MSYAALAKNAYAQYGRGSDTEMVHATPGEVMLPPEFQAQNPEVMARLAKAISDMGLDPNDFVVGNDTDPNPWTGLEEHGWFKKIIKSITKNILPTIGSVVGGAVAGPLGIGASIGSGLGAGLGSFASSKDPLTAALTGLGAYAGAEFLGPELGLDGSFLGASAGSQAGGALGAFGASALSNLAFSGGSEKGMSIDVPGSNLPAANKPPALNTGQTPNTPLPTTGSGVSQLSPIKYLDVVKNRDTGQDEYIYVSPFGSSLAYAGNGSVFRI
jgi:hypothetical protein